MYVACALAFLLTVLQAEKQRWIFLFPSEFIMKNEGQIPLTLLCAVEKYSVASASRAPKHLILKSILLKQLLLEVTHKRVEPSLLPLCDGIKDLSDKLA